MKVCLVGHGPSLQKRPRGDEIDSFDKVIRQKASELLLEYPEYYGAKTDAVCYSLRLIQLNKVRIPAPEYWSFVDSRFQDLKEETLCLLRRKFLKKYGVPLRVDKDLCEKWNYTYLKMRWPFELEPQQEVTKFSDELGHLHMSAGTHLIVNACEFLKPKEIILAGYDSVVSGKWTWSAARGPKWVHYPDHRFDVENKMLPLIAERYDVEIRPL